MKLKWLAGAFAIFIIFALGLVGNMVQSNSIANAFYLSFGASQWLVGLCIATLAGLVVVGGLHRIAAFTEKMVPVMVVIYLIGATVVLVINYTFIVSAFKLIIIAAFNPQAVMGGPSVYPFNRLPGLVSPGVCFPMKPVWVPRPTPTQ